MIKSYLKTILILIVINIIITGLFGFFSQWDSPLIIAGIVNFSILVLALFSPYFLLQIEEIRYSMLKMSIVVFVPSLIMIMLLVRNIIQLNSGHYIELGYGIIVSEFGLKPRHLKLIQTLLVIIANFSKYIKLKHQIIQNN